MLCLAGTDQSEWFQFAILCLFINKLRKSLPRKPSKSIKGRRAKIYIDSLRKAASKIFYGKKVIEFCYIDLSS
jgi:hypothetical protein